MRVLYIQGLDSKLSQEKNTILRKFGHVLASDLDYYNDSSAIESILGQYGNQDIDAVIGSSLGGFAA